jgi:hypothetical protein
MPIDQPEPDGPDASPAVPAGGGDGADYREHADRADHRADAGPARPRRAARAGRAEQRAAHAEQREAVAAAYQAAADRDAWAAAVPRLRADWTEHQGRYPERERASPRTGADGSWVGGEYRRLDPEQNTEASKAHADLADEADRHIRPAMLRVEAADPERELAGLEHMVKGEDRLKEKLADAWHGRPELNVRQVLGMIPDAVRFTLAYSSERYAEGVLADVDRLKAEGFELIKLKNLWHADQYKGVNSQWFRSETGTRFEMQFHTPESLEAKELTHRAYERIRANAMLPVDEQDLDEEQELESFQRRVNALIAIPPGTDRVKDFPEKNDDG